MEKEAEAKGMLEILNRQAEGFGAIVKATNGNSKDAVLMIIADKLEDLVKTQVEAIKNIKIDKVTVWENGSGGDGEGNATSKFVSGLYKSVPPMSDLFNMAGMDLPQYLGQKTETSTKLTEGKEVVEE
jgi:flotillin